MSSDHSGKNQTTEPMNQGELSEEVIADQMSSMEEEEDERETNRKFYDCSYCKKVFFSSQALGGHQNAHKKERALDKIRTAAANNNRYHPYSYSYPYPCPYYGFMNNYFGAAPSSCYLVGGSSSTRRNSSNRAPYFHFCRWQPDKSTCKLPTNQNRMCCLSDLCRRNSLLTTPSFCQNPPFNITASGSDDTLGFSAGTVRSMTRAAYESPETSLVLFQSNTRVHSDTSSVNPIRRDASHDMGSGSDGSAAGINLQLGLKIEECDGQLEETDIHDLTLKL